jgi:hypothetical protein
MGKTHGPTSHTHCINAKTQKSHKRGRDPVISASLGRSIFDQPVEVPKMVKHDQGCPKLGQGPTHLLALQNLEQRQ